MLYPIKVVDIELTQLIPTLEGLEEYMGRYSQVWCMRQNQAAF